MRMNMNDFVEITNLSKSYDGKRNAVDNLTLTLQKGRIIGLLGPNGSGKTTLIKMMNGLLWPDRGEIRIGGQSVGIDTKARVSYLPDRTYLAGGLRVSETLEFFRDFYEDFSVQKAQDMLESLHIDPLMKMNQLSKGMREKVQLILVMSRSADLYILDEPIAGVDPAARDYILRTIINNYNPESALLISTHLISDIEKVLDEVVFLREGRMVLHSSTDDIRGEFGKSVDDYFREVFAC